MPYLPTIAVFHPNGVDRIVINEKDYDPTIHRHWDVSPVPAAPSPIPPPSASPPSPPPTISAPPVSIDPVEARRVELEEMDWREIKAIAEGFDPPIPKPEGGWDDAVQLIIDREFPGG